MTRRTFLSLFPGLAVAGGCQLSKDTTAPHTPWYDPFEVFGSSPDAVVLMTSLIDRPGGDPYLNDGLWASADKPLPHETAALLAENGIRVGVISGIPPAEFSALVTSDKSTTARRLNLRRLNEPKVLPILGPVEALEYSVLSGLKADRVGVSVAGAECGFEVTPAPADDDRVTISFKPQVQHGPRQSWIKAAADGSGFAWDNRKPLEDYPALACSVTLEKSDYLIVGATDKPAGTIGEAFFFAKEPGRIRQRVLVVRASRGGPVDAGIADAAPRPTRSVAARAAER
ncbi:MAG TPA: hypothetical protein VGJ05_08490 [Fimbriiglobus sp.]|jgi:hypothetical protein